ncbi:hypothetical protein GEMRC1_011524 [Eukaryota sp. GEM-RC1]
MKARLTSTDLFHVIAELKSRILGSYVTNIYDVDTRLFLFKLHRPEHNETLLYESGVRFHSSAAVSRETGVPSGFTLKLRKHLRGRRLVNIEQVGIDRVVKLSFGFADQLCFLVLELFTPGNVILLNSSNEILSCLRRSTPGSEPRIAPGSVFIPEMHARTFHPVSISSLSLPLQKAAASRDIIQKKKKKGLQGFPPNSIGNSLATFFSLGPQYTEVVLRRAGVEPRTLAQEVLDSEAIMNSIVSQFNVLEQELLSPTEKHEGYILFKENAPQVDLQEAVATGVSEFELISRKLRELSTTSIVEFLPKLIEEDPAKILKISSFNFAIDVCFARLEEASAQADVESKQRAVDQKLVKIESFHEQQVSSLENTEVSLLKKARVVEENVELVDLILETVSTCVNSGMNFKDILKLIENSHEGGLGQFVHSSNLPQRKITIFLPLYNETTEEEEAVTVELSLSETALSNVRHLYEKAKKARHKKSKALDAHSSVVKRAEKKAQKAVDHMSLRASVVHSRTTFWFEKFNWFISSENFVVVAGRDLMQNEILVKRYLSPKDIYIHSTVHGAASVLIKIKDVYPTNVTLQEAGGFAVCHSRCWEQKVVSSSYWVFGHQVSQTAPTGMSVASGSFVIRGKKNFLDTSPLIMGVGILFKLGDVESIQRHGGDRKLKGNTVELIPSTSAEMSMDEDDGAVVEEEAAWEDALEARKKKKKEDEGKVQQVVFEEAEDHVDVDVTLGDLITNDPSIKPSSSQTKKKVSKAERRLQKKAKDMGISYEELMERKQLEKAEADRLEALRLEEGKEKQRLEELRLEEERLAAERLEQQMLQEERILADEEIEIDEETDDEKTDGVEDDGDESDLIDKKPVDLGVLRCFNCGGPHKRVDCPHQKLAAKEKRQRVHADQEIERTLLGEQQELIQADADLSSLSHIPVPEDVLLYGIPVCAPWSCVQHYKYRIKMTPGNTKKGKASQSVIEYLSKMAKIQRESDLIKCLSPQEISMLMPGKVSLSVGKGKKH